ncbi:MAG: hypothetical protein U9N85_11880 [Bacteroidota bacterium]|nr:hypothetical protein [Bacteroidota bacterium]
MSVSQTISNRNPYPGIRSFNISESNLFYGRDKQIRELSHILKSSNFVAISGASGSGKSSLIKAGLIPQIIQKKEKWSVAVSRPGDDPIGNLALQLHRIIKTENGSRIGSIRKIKSRFLNNELSLSELFENTEHNKNVLLYIDQFEELFRYKNDSQNKDSENNADRFVSLLLDAIHCENKNFYVILSLRSDFLGECSFFSGLSEAINIGHYLIPKMTQQQKMESITEPAKTLGVEITDRLIKQLQKDISSNGDNLLVLQHAMMRTWDYKLLHSPPNAALDINHYEAVGTVTKALSSHAEAIYNSIEKEEDRITLERIFKSLTELGDDKKGIRRPATINEISKITGTNPADIISVTKKFREEGNSFLMPDIHTTLSADSILDISHESIMKVWDRLATWVSQETESAQTYLRLSKSAELYQAGKGGLLTNPDLQLALQWVEENAPNQFWAERYDPAFERVLLYIKYSDKEYKKMLLAKEEKQKKQIKRTRIVAFFLGSASLISIMFLIVAMNLKIKAEASENKAKENEKIALSKSKYAEEQKRDAIANGLIANQQKQIAQQQRLLAEDQKEVAVVQRAIADREKTRAVKATKQVTKEKKKVDTLLNIAKNLKNLALEREKVAIEQRLKAIESEKNAVAARKLSTSKSLAIQAAKIFNDNKKAKRLTAKQEQLPYQLVSFAHQFFNASEQEEYDSEIFNALSLIAEENVLIRSPEGHSAAVRGGMYSPDNSEFITISDDGSIRKFAPDGKLITVYYLKDIYTKSKTHFIKCFAYSPDGKSTVFGMDNGDILLLKKSNNTLKILNTSSHSLQDLIFVSNTNAISIGNSGKIIFHQNITGTHEQFLIKNTETNLVDIAVNANFTKIAVAEKTGTILTFNVSKPFNIDTQITIESLLSSIEWGKNNDLLAATSTGKVLIIANQKIKKEFYAHKSTVNSLVYDDDSERLYTCGYDKSIKIWSYNNFDYATIIEPEHSWVHSIDLSRNKSVILATYDDNSIELINIDIDKLLRSVKNKITTEISDKNWERFIGSDIEKPESNQ